MWYLTSVKTAIEFVVSGSFELTTPVKWYKLECKKHKPAPLSPLSTLCPKTRYIFYIRHKLILITHLTTVIGLFYKKISKLIIQLLLGTSYNSGSQTWPFFNVSDLIHVNNIFNNQIMHIKKSAVFAWQNHLTTIEVQYRFILLITNYV